MVEKSHQPTGREIEAKEKCQLTGTITVEVLQTELPWELPLHD
jgi:hypothetical protein